MEEESTHELDDGAHSFLFFLFFAPPPPGLPGPALTCAAQSGGCGPCDGDILAADDVGGGEISNVKTESWD